MARSALEDTEDDNELFNGEIKSVIGGHLAWKYVRGLRHVARTVTLQDVQADD